jgi:hypothetical protein
LDQVLYLFLILLAVIRNTFWVWKKYHSPLVNALPHGISGLVIIERVLYLVNIISAVFTIPQPVMAIYANNRRMRVIWVCGRASEPFFFRFEVYMYFSASNISAHRKTEQKSL